MLGYQQSAEVTALLAGLIVPGVSSQGGVVQGVEAVVVGDGDVSASLQQHRQHVVSLLTDGVVQGGVALRVLHGDTFCHLLLRTNYNMANGK